MVNNPVSECHRYFRFYLREFICIILFNIKAFKQHFQLIILLFGQGRLTNTYNQKKQPKYENYSFHDLPHDLYWVNLPLPLAEGISVP